MPLSSKAGAVHVDAGSARPVAPRLADAATAPAAHANIAHRFRDMARAFPEKPAVIFPKKAGARSRTVYERKTYRQIDEESDALAYGFRRAGIGKGTRTIVMVNWNADMFALMYALAKVGATAVFVDPGMGVSRMLHCYKASQAEAFIGIPLGHVFRVFNPKTFGSLKSVVTVGRRWFWGGHSIRELAEPTNVAFPIAEVDPEDVYTVLFTTGSTEAARAVGFSFGLFRDLFTKVPELLDTQPDDVTLATVPIVGILDLFFGATVVIPPINPIKLADADPEILARTIREFGITKMCVSPSFLRRVGDYADERGEKFESIKKVMLMGGSATATLLERFRRTMPASSKLEVVYGATEAGGMAKIEYAELAETDRLTGAGAGGCAGRPIMGCEVRVIGICEGPVPTWSDALMLAPGEVGELVAAGPMVSATYFDAPDVDARSKIRDGERIWHRTGDAGHIDEHGRIWVCGRVIDRILTPHGSIFPTQWEGILNMHPEVYRTAVVPVPARVRVPTSMRPAPAVVPVVCVELKTWQHEGARRRIEQELRELSKKHAVTQTEAAATFLFRKSFPVDARHNVKINRTKLSAWAAAELSAGPFARAKALLGKLGRRHWAAT